MDLSERMRLTCDDLREAGLADDAKRMEMAGMHVAGLIGRALSRGVRTQRASEVAQ